jgi:serine/threonine protein kinase/tetratricopeptide (TPR) repeat protein
MELRSLGDYRILRELGVGGMLTVYEAEDARLERRVSLKVMKPEFAGNPHDRERFLREARTAARVQSAFICPVYEVGEENGVPFVAMPFLQGEPLNSHCKTGMRLAAGEVVRIGKEVAEGLIAAHDAGLVHRDIEPANIWLETQPGGPPRAIILDFGLARVQDEAQQITQSGTIVGTPAYMSPEQACGNKVDARTDLFSLGCVLYALCTGELPFKGTALMDVLVVLATQEPTPPHTVSASIPQALSRLIVRLLAKNPDDRPPTARDVVEVLAAIEREVTPPVQGAVRTRIKPAAKSGRSTLPISQDTESIEVLPPSALRRKSSYTLYTLIAAGVLGCIIALVGGAICFYVVTDTGTIEILTEAENVQLLLLKDGQEMKTLDAASKKTWSVPTGKYTLRLKGDPLDLEMQALDTLKVTRGSKHAVTIRRLSAGDYIQQGRMLAGSGQLDTAIAEFRKAIALDPKETPRQDTFSGSAHYNLGLALCKLGKLDEARAVFQQACPEPGSDHAFFANALRRAGRMVEGEAEAREAIRLKPNADFAHQTLGWALMGQKKWVGAIAAYREAVRLKPDNSVTRWELAISLENQGLYEEAIPEVRKAIELDPREAAYHNSLGWCLYNTGNADEAIASYREAIQRNSTFIIAHSNLGDALKDKGELDEAIACYRKADQLDPTATWVGLRLARAQRMAAARDRFPAFQDGSYKPATRDERLALAEWCTIKKLHHTATGLWAAAFADDPKLADELNAAHRWNAARDAALAAAGKGEDAAHLDDQERARLRKQALNWLRADLVLREKQFETGNPADREAARWAVRNWQVVPEFAGIRDAAALAKLSADERTGLTQLWTDVAELLNKAEEKAK